ncbi:Cof-type HAD-IIB family hydrolase [Lapidilactobacillus achengensis]|uniref:Cof-type HAD-IIB family hydrolase n=1 Tax=Lapidilactobacillus achengensis TaxID=2486000 RepID=A0ABW1UQI5_9LACO|nr:Cof-type HAD-IIB family hydrolase [Lapidilactobacillus achengensis]
MATEYRGVVFFDLDGTLLNEHSQISPEVGTAIHQLRKNGYLPVINTGRSPLEIVDTCQATGIDTFVSLNGSYLEHRQRPVYQGVIETELIRGMVDLATELNDSLSFYSKDAIHAIKDDANLQASYHSIHTPVPTIEPAYYLTHEILMLLVLTTKNDQIYQERFPEFTYYRNGAYSIDTVRQGNSKMNGIIELIDRLHLTDLPTYGFGDGPNDLTMLNYVDHAVAMANGIPAAKEAAEFVTNSNRDGGIIKGLQHFDLI